jgi:hypothetical protein
MTEELYTAAEVAERTGRSPVTVRQLARTHNIGRRLGRDWVFTAADIEALTTLPKPGRPISAPGKVAEERRERQRQRRAKKKAEQS